MSAGEPVVATRTHSAFAPALLIVLALLAWSGFQTYQLVLERNGFNDIIAGQDSQMDRSQKIRVALQNLATRTAQVARAGNANATIIVEELRKRGITINPDEPLAK